MLFLSRRAKHEDVSLFVHVADPDVLGSLIADQLSKIEGLTGCWIISMLKPIFFPLPRDTSKMRRSTITVKVFPPRLADTYESLSRPDLPPRIMMAYLAYTCHLYGDCLQFSMLAKNEDSLNRYIADKVRTLPGVLRTTVDSIERTRPLVSYDEWKDYSTLHSIVPSWDERFMIHQFGD